MKLLRRKLTKIPLSIWVVSLYISSAALLGSIDRIADASTPPSMPVIVEVPIPEPKPKNEVLQGKPVQFSATRLGINLPIYDGAYTATSNDWTLRDGAVFFAAMTAEPNNAKGSTFLYGHNNASALAPLANIAAGDQATVKTSNGYTFTYAYSYDEIITPDIVDVLYEKPHMPRLVVMTCEGIWSKERRLMYFDLVSAS